MVLTVWRRRVRVADSMRGRIIAGSGLEGGLGSSKVAASYMDLK